MRIASSLLAAVSLSLASCSVDPPAVTAARVTGSINVALAGPLETTDPAMATTFAEHLLLRTACDGLTAINPVDGQAEPALASRWSFSSDGTRLMISLRTGAKFGDGSAVTAGAVKASLGRVTDPSQPSPWAHTLANVRQIEVEGPSRLTMILNRPDHELPQVLAHPALIPVSPGPEQVTCSGPYRIVAEEGSFRLVHSGIRSGQNEAYKDRGPGRFRIIHVKPFATEAEAFDTYLAKQSQIAPVPRDRIQEAESLARAYFRSSTLQVHYLLFGVAEPQVADPSVRKAFSLAIDRLLLVDAAFGDQREPAVRWLLVDGAPPAPSCAQAIRKVSDPAAARQLLATSGIDGSKIKLQLAYDSSQIAAVIPQALRVQIKDVLGAEVVPQGLDTADLSASIAARRLGVVWLVSSDPTSPTVSDQLGSLFGTGGPRNLGGFTDAAVDAGLDRSRGSGGHSRRIAHGAEVEDLVCAGMPAVPLYRGVRHWVMDPSQVAHEGDSRLDLFGAPVLREMGTK